MKRMMVSLPVGIWTFVILSGCVGIQVAQEVQLGRNALQTGQPQVAVGYLRNAAELDPNYKTPYSIRESVWTYLGRAYHEIGNFPEARRALEKALSDDKDDPLARLYLGLTLLRAGDQREGRRETEAGLRGINNLLNGLASSPSSGIYWDPTRQIRSDIQRVLSAKGTLESSELITVGERVGSRLDDEIDNARLDESRDKYNRGGDM
ncbi:MAG TPA: tetratricopeptide repeat protein [Candidatus Binatia bacterium]